MSDDQAAPERGTNFARRTRRVQGNQEYLDVKWRKLWVVEDVENGVYGDNASLSYETELLRATDDYALFKAVVTIADENGRLVRRGCGHGEETTTGFKGFLLKAETSAIGRALQTIGYGTEALPDDKRVVDSPRETRNPAPANTAPAPNRTPTPIDERRPANASTDAVERPANKGQIDGIQRLARLAGLTDAGLAEHLASVGAASLDGLTFDQAGKVLGKLQER